MVWTSKDAWMKLLRCGPIGSFLRLERGDVIITGAPAGVGMGRKPPKYLKAGDVVIAEVSGLGRQTQRARDQA
jgi:2-keto-4-pentenoate hydratase/2-oxohepta-3-ene-1,7-dioic acid hydratase in catechol pathway